VRVMGEMDYFEPEHLLGGAVVNIDVDLTGDKYSQVKFFEYLNCSALQLSGNGIDLILRLDGEHLQKIADQLAEWGYLPSEESLADLDEKFNPMKKRISEVRSILDGGEKVDE